jgi:hypothetical protein
MCTRFAPTRRFAAPCCLALGAIAAILAAFMAVPTARAALAPASLIDGPSAAIIDVDGAAMAPDGSGGIVYRKLLAGQPHVFVSRFLNGAFQPPVQADGGQPFAATFPAIAAGDGGRLLVVWAEPYAVVGAGGEVRYQLMSSELQPGAGQFSPAEQVDPKDIGNGTAAFPSLAMAPNGKAYVAYRVVTNGLQGFTSPPLHAGDEPIAVRVARYNGAGLPWSSIGTLNSHPELTMRAPHASNAPVIGVSLNGSAVLLWQEPNALGVAQIFARRIFPGRLGNPLQVSPESAGGQPITAEADAPAMAVNIFGEARIAYRLASSGSARIFLDLLPSEVDTKGAKLHGAHPVAGAPALGPPSVAIDESGDYRLAYTARPRAASPPAARTTWVQGGNDFKASIAPATLGNFGTEPIPSEAEERVANSINPAGGGVAVWLGASATRQPVVDARQDFKGGGWQLAELAAPISGSIGPGPPVLGASSQGDALIAFGQGPPGQQQVMASVAKSPPGQFIATTPIGWVSGGAATVSWEVPAEALGSTSYAVLVDGRVRVRGLTGLSVRLDSRGLGDGIHHVQVLATDSLGQQTMTPPAELQVDANPPEASVRRLGGHRVLVRVSDRASGAVAGRTWIAFGDGAGATHRLRAGHAYARPGRYVIVVRSRDRVSHWLLAHIRVQVR